MDTRDDSKEVVVSGCKVKLLFREASGRRWTVQGTVHCGIEDNARATTFNTKPCASREEAEKIALGKAGELIGKGQQTEQK